jgi:hypothetical protein
VASRHAGPVPEMLGASALGVGQDFRILFCHDEKLEGGLLGASEKRKNAGMKASATWKNPEIPRFHRAGWLESWLLRCLHPGEARGTQNARCAAGAPLRPCPGQAYTGG